MLIVTRLNVRETDNVITTQRRFSSTSLARCKDSIKNNGSYTHLQISPSGLPPTVASVVPHVTCPYKLRPQSMTTRACATGIPE